MLYPLRAVVVFSAVAFGCNVAAAAVPSGAEPDAPLAVRDDARSREWLALTLRLYGEAKAGVNTICDKTDGQKFKALKPIVFGQTHVKLLRCERMAKLLSIWGEPAGADFTLRADELRAPFQRAVKAYAALPGSSEKTNKELQLLQREADRRVSVLPKIKQLGDKGEWEAAGVVLYETLDAMELFAVWFDSEARKPIFSRFFSSQSRVDTNLEELWRKRLTQTLTESREKQLPDFGRMLAEAQTAAAALRSAAKAEAGGEQRDGPAALAYFGQRSARSNWRRSIARRSIGRWAQPESGKTLAQLRDEHAKFAKEIGPALEDHRKRRCPRRRRRGGVALRRLSGRLAAAGHAARRRRAGAGGGPDVGAVGQEVGSRGGGGGRLSRGHRRLAGVAATPGGGVGQGARGQGRLCCGKRTSMWPALRWMIDSFLWRQTLSIRPMPDYCFRRRRCSARWRRR